MISANNRVRVSRMFAKMIQSVRRNRFENIRFTKIVERTDDLNLAYILESLFIDE